MTPPAQITYRLMQPGDETAVFDLVTRVFDRFVAPGYQPGGVQEFFRYLQPELLLKHIQENCFSIVAEAPDKQMVGVIEVRNHDHISLLFVDEAWQGQGIGRALWDQARAMCLQERPDLTEISLNSSPYAVPIYERLGFRAVKSEQLRNGMRFTPMVFRLTQTQSGT